MGGGESVMKKAFTCFVALAVMAGAQPPSTPPATAPPATAPQVGAPAKSIPMGPVNLQNASLAVVIDSLARLLKLNVIVDPAVKGSITLNTYGDPTHLDARNMLEMILRINGFGLIQDGEIWRILPLKSIKNLPMHPEINQKNLAEDDQTVLNMVSSEIRQCRRISQGIKGIRRREFRHDFLRPGQSFVPAR